MYKTLNMRWRHNIYIATIIALFSNNESFLDVLASWGMWTTENLPLEEKTLATQAITIVFPSALLEID